MLQSRIRLFSITLIALGIPTLVLSQPPSANGNPYVKKATWAETMVASRETLLAETRGTAFEPFSTGVIRGGDQAQQVSVNVTGLDQLWLVATVGEDDYNFDQALWAEPRLIAEDGTVTSLLELKPVSAEVGWGQLLISKDQLGKPLQVADRVFADGFWAHAPSALCFTLDRKYARFEAWVGIGVAAGKNGSARFQVLHQKGRLENLWDRMRRDFPTESARMERDAPGGRHLAWFSAEKGAELETAMLQGIVDELGAAGGDLRTAFDALRGESRKPNDTRMLALYAQAGEKRDRVCAAKAQLKLLNFEALRLAIEDLARDYPDRYPEGPDFLKNLEAHEKWAAGVQARAAQGELVELEQLDAILGFQRRALLANPLLDFDALLAVRRGNTSPALGLPANWQGNCSLPRSGYDNDIVRLSAGDEGAFTELAPVFRPEGSGFVGDVDLHFDGDRMMFSMSDKYDPWHIWEVGVDGTGLRKVSPCDEPDVDCYDPCYLPDGRILFSCTAPMRGVPCVDGSSFVANLYLLNEDGQGMRQLCFDQEHNWCPTVLNNGRVLYLRWEYTDTPHSQTRLLFSMNPDGTSQMEYYGSNSFWPNGVFYARPVPGHPTMVAGIVTGHHGVRRMGELVLFDPAKGRHEANGVVQRIAQRGKQVEAVIKDQLVDDSWPKFLHPYPLSEKYFLVSCKPDPDALWGIYLVDVFDNMLLLREEPGYALLEPIPLRPTPRPPAIADKVDLARNDAVVYLADVHAGPGLKGIPRGAVKKLRVFTYHYSYRTMGGLLGVVGMDGPWDIKRVLGTVPVEPDGSAMFRVPANTPIAVHPLDAEGKALQRMRSWFTGMPGEVLSCVGCHEKVNSGPPVSATMASRREPSEITPWHGPVRGFSFAREVQPVLDTYCLKCHDGKPDRPDLRGTERLTDWKSVTPGQGGRLGGQFSVSYAALQKHVRRPGIESDYHLLEPMEFHADTTELVQMLKSGHHGVQLDEESWDRLVTWIDLNAPFHGYWHEIDGEKAKTLAARQVELGERYGGTTENAEIIPELPLPQLGPVADSRPAEPSPASPESANWPFAEQAPARQQEAGRATLAGAHTKTVDLGGGAQLSLVLVPAGEFVMADGTGRAALVPIDEPFWMSRCEITNEQFALFDPNHDSRVETKHAYQFGVHGFPVNEPLQPVVRVTWRQANAFCAWLSAQTGAPCSLPTEAQWEYACRAGADTPFHYGGQDADFSAFANLADAKLREFADNPYHVYKPLTNATPYDDWIPKDTRFNDGALVSAPVGRYQPNAWGLHDMHGNVWEWTRTVLQVYPYREDDGRNAPDAEGKRVVRGGSWYDRPKRALAGFRLAYEPWQPVFNVGFRVVFPVETNVVARNASTR
jgi:formylglycine-generating enzyme required for sulfatase activity